MLERAGAHATVVSMRAVALAALVSLGGCFTIGGHGALAGPVSGAPSRPLHGAFEVGGFFGTKRVIVNPVAAVGLGPLAESKRVAELGVRGFYNLSGQPYAAFARVGHQLCGDPPCSTSTSVVLGASLFTASDEGGIVDGMATSVAGLNLGVVYRHQAQDGLGGHFLGLELSVGFGYDVVSAISGISKQRAENRR